MLSDECIIVTGASGNLGAAVSRVLALQGARVACVDRTEARFDPAADGIDAARVMMITGRDLSSKDAVDAVVAETVARFGKVTGLVNTVGGFATGRVTENALDQWATRNACRAASC